MKLFKSFFISLFLVSLISCSPEQPGENPVRKVKRDITELKVKLHETMKDYEKVKDIMKEKQKLYEEMVAIYYAINRIHNKLVKNMAVSKEALEHFQKQIEVLNEILADEDVPVEIREKLKQVVAETQHIQETLSAVSEKSIAEEVVEVQSIEEEMQSATSSPEVVSESAEDVEQAVATSSPEAVSEEAEVMKALPYTATSSPEEVLEETEEVHEEVIEIVPLEEAPVEEAPAVEVEEAPAEHESTMEEEEEVILEGTVNIHIENVIQQ